METDELIDAILADIARTLQAVDPAQIEAMQATVLTAKRIFIAGKGRSGLQMKAFAMRLMHLGLTVHVVDDVTTPALAEHDLLLIGSSSGRTGSLLRYIESTKTTGARLAAITGESGFAYRFGGADNALHPRYQFQSRPTKQQKVRTCHGIAFRA